MEANAEVARSGDFCGQEISCTSRVNVEMVGGRRASGQREFCETDPRRDVCGFLVQRAPQWIQRLQPTEERRIRHRRERASEILIQVVMGVDEPRSHQTVGRVDDDVGERFLPARTKVGNQTIGDGDETTGDLASLFVNGRNERRVANEEICASVQPLSSTSSLPSWRISASR